MRPYIMRPYIARLRRTSPASRAAGEAVTRSRAHAASAQDLAPSPITHP